MQTVIKLTNCIILLTVFKAMTLTVSCSGSYTRGLIKYLKDESKLHQVMFIIDDQLLNSSSSSYSLLTEVSKHIPSYSLNFTKLRFESQNTFPSALQRPKGMTLFIMLLNGNRSDLWDQMNFSLKLLKQLMQKDSYPKCLINFISHTESDLIQEVLKYFWSQGFTEIEVLEHLQENQKTLTKGTERRFILHEINEFAKVYTTQTVTSQTKWFPNKLLNLNGHKIKFILTTLYDTIDHRYYFVLLKLSRILTDSLRTSGLILRFRITEASVLLKLLNHENAEMVINIFKDSNTNVHNQQLRVIGYSFVKAIIPKVENPSKAYIISQEFVLMVAATTVVICFTRIMAFLMKFDKSTWQIFNISRIVIGMSVDREPNKVTERIVFGSLILSCIVYSGYLFSVILDVTFRNEPEISSLEELANSSLTPMLTSYTKNSLLLSSISYIRQLGMKSIECPGRGYAYDCLTYLAKYGNVTFITDEAESYVMKFKQQVQDIKVKILQEPLAFYSQSWISRNGSPFLDHFNKVILKASEAGLLTKLLPLNNWSKSTILPPEQIAKEKLFLIVSHLLVIGYTLATIVFIAEMVYSIIWRKVNYFCRHWLNG
ncbi:uncharacterized protein LOC122502651 [Leptopilina heterotoma]|uniref:uncharacterized protein LOC122502651 n=1 Tax=Leptopilina heterotoma TaxID=63436 RepID=UPI001CA7E80D|nr:uncharacterized protein LOC122502651 [Leptopilina heterotoma]